MGDSAGLAGLAKLPLKGQQYVAMARTVQHGWTPSIAMVQAEAYVGLLHRSMVILN